MLSLCVICQCLHTHKIHKKRNLFLIIASYIYVENMDKIAHFKNLYEKK